MDKLLLTLITFLPLVGGALILLTPAKRDNLVRGIAVFTSLVVFALTLILWKGFDAAALTAQSVYSGYDAKTLIEVAWIQIGRASCRERVSNCV